jgi:site-specific DNA-cytosine methylase/uncharacterized protein YjiS (DUF1127 family)
LKVTPATLQTCWLITKHLSNSKLSERDLGALLSVTTNSRKAFMQALDIAESLGWIERKDGNLAATRRGCTLSTLTSWRLLQPSKVELNLLKEHKLTDILISEKDYGNRPKVIDLFGGVGGLSLAFEAAGFQVVASIDNDPQACEAHEKNFPDSKLIKADINRFAHQPTKFLSEVGIDGEIAGVIGGPPCQGFSNIGERVVDDDRNFLTTRFTEVVLKIKPKFFMMENVAGLKTIGKRPDLADHLKELCKPIGSNASSLCTSLPAVEKNIAKRETQFKKRLISLSVSLHCAVIDQKISCSNRPPQETFANEDLVSLYLTSFNEAVLSISGDLFRDKGWLNEARNALSIKESEIQKISIGAFACALMGSKKWEADQIVSLLEKGSRSKKLKAVLKDVMSSYESQPTGVIYGKEEIGPILFRIISRVSKDYIIYGPKLLRAYQYGSPQNRQRLFLVGIRKDVSSSFEFPAETHAMPDKSQSFLVSAPTCEEALSDLPDVDQFPDLIKDDKLSVGYAGSSASDYAQYLRYERIEEGNFNLPRPSWNPLILDCCARTIHSDHVISRLSKTSEGIQDKTSGKTRLKKNSVSHTLRAGTREEKGSHTAVRPVHYEYNRVITVREGARLMGFPDWMTFHPTKWHGFRLVGNAVPFHLGNAMAKQLLRLFKD